MTQKTTYYAIEVDKDNHLLHGGKLLKKGQQVPICCSDTIKHLAWVTSMSEASVRRGIKTQKPVGNFFLYRIDTDLDRLAASLGLVKGKENGETNR